MTFINNSCGADSFVTSLPMQFLIEQAGIEWFTQYAIICNDYRQSKKETLYTGSVTNPVFKQLLAPLDGRVINLSARISL